ncbi:MAG: hypothetical protein HXY40_16435 [Chloroflexi bacterium]|nr:hypothetical protein [Chloroflexota bacterium]
MIERIRNYIRDSYNGLYKIVLEPYMPKRNTVLAIVAGLFIGLFVAYVISPTVFYNADPSQLGQSWQDEWVKLLADRFAAANFQVDDNIRSLLAAVDDPVEIITRVANAEGNPSEAERFRRLLPFAQEVQNAGQTAQAPDTGSAFSGVIVPFIIIPIVAVIVFVIFTLVWNLLIYQNIVGPLIAFIKRGGKRSEASVELGRIREQRRLSEEATKQTAAALASSGLGPPVFTKMSIYMPGRAYDDSFAIETADDVFLGECGASISDTIADKVSAIEVWLFDKEDFTRTLTHVFVAPPGFADPATRAKLEVKGDLVEAKPGAVTLIETNALRMEVKIVDLVYATAGGVPPNGAFDRATIQFAVWQKGAGAVTVKPTAAATVTPVAAAPMQSFAPPPMPTYAPPPTPAPPATPTYAPPPYNPPPSGGAPTLTPLKPPPLGGTPPATQPPRPPQQDDDLFGGTGDFTPVGS